MSVASARAPLFKTVLKSGFPLDGEKGEISPFYYDFPTFFHVFPHASHLFKNERGKISPFVSSLKESLKTPLHTFLLYLGTFLNVAGQNRGSERRYS